MKMQTTEPKEEMRVSTIESFFSISSLCLPSPN